MRLPIILAFVFSVTASCMLRQPPAATASSFTPCDDKQRDGDYDDRDKRSTPPPQAQDPEAHALTPMVRTLIAKSMTIICRRATPASTSSKITSRSCKTAQIETKFQGAGTRMS
jgi:hypothetical protein